MYHYSLDSLLGQKEVVCSHKRVTFISLRLYCKLVRKMDCKRKAKGILNYFTKMSRNEVDPSRCEAVETTAACYVSSSDSENIISLLPEAKVPHNEVKSTSLRDDTASTSELVVTPLPNCVTNDISEYNHSLIESFDVHEKLQKFQYLFVPDAKYKFPQTLQSGQHRKFNASWLEKYFWLAYSSKEDGAFCKYCVFFAKVSSGKGNHQNLGALVTYKFSKWKHALEAFSTHGNNSYHKMSIIDGANFIHMMTNKTESVQYQLNKKLAEQVKKNRKQLVPIIQAVILCGRQEIPLRGHKDSGSIEVDKEER